MSRAFENDPRLKHMDPGKLSALQSLAKELEAAPGDQKMAAFLSASQKAAREHVSFSAKEQELLIQILKACPARNGKKQKPSESWQDGCRKTDPVHNKKGVPQKQAV